MPKDNLIGNLETSVAEKMKKKAAGGKPSRNINVGGARGPVKNVNVGGSRGPIKDKIVRIGGGTAENDPEYMPGSLAKPTGRIPRSFETGKLVRDQSGRLVEGYFIPNPEYKKPSKKDVKREQSKRPMKSPRRGNVIEVPGGQEQLAPLKVNKGKWVGTSGGRKNLSAERLYRAGMESK